MAFASIEMCLEKRGAQPAHAVARRHGYPRKKRAPKDPLSLTQVGPNPPRFLTYLKSAMISSITVLRVALASSSASIR